MPQKFTVLFRGEEESWNSFSRRIREAQGEVVVVLSSVDNNFLLQEDDRTVFLEACAKIRYRLRLASKEPAVISHARRLGIRVYDRTRKLRVALAGNEKAAEALRFFSPSLWRQQWRSRLQTVGLLSLPRLRIWALVFVSTGMFLFVLLRLLPSADVRVWPRSDIITHTINVTLVQSGATVQAPAHVRTQPLEFIRVHVRKSLTFDDISPEFTGTDASVRMTVYNTSNETFSLRAGTRMSNQAGMIFRLQEPVIVRAGSRVEALAKADHEDLYGEIIGARGNVPAGLQWDFPGLSPAERKFVYAKNTVAAAGGTTSSRMVLQKRDLDLGKKRLQQELLVEAQQLMEEERLLRNAQNPDMQLELLAKDDIIVKTYTGIVLPTQFLGQAVLSVPIEGELMYSIPAYNLQGLLAAYSKELHAHAAEGKQLIPGTVHIDPQKVIVIEYDDNLAWIKMTLDIVGTEQFLLDPLSPNGAHFGKKVREAVAGLNVSDAQRIIRNFPEIDRVEIRVWPPWGRVLPTILSNISITPQ